jgi:hypothetical protein
MSVEQIEYIHDRRKKTPLELEVANVIEEKLNDKIGDLNSRLLSVEEVTQLRKIILQDAHARWFWASFRTWILAISAAIALLTVGFDGIKTILRRLVA